MSILHLLICSIGFGIVLAKGYESNNNEPLFYELKQGNLTVTFTNLGARVASISFPDKNGELADVLLGHDTIQEYKKDIHNFNAITGRYTNIIKGAEFTMNGTNYKLTPNDGKDTLNGGHIGYGFVNWKMTHLHKCKSFSYIIFTYKSFDGEEGFPGNLTIRVKHTITPYKLITTLHAKTLNKDTPINLGQHMAFNLAGNGKNNILSHDIQIFSSNYIETTYPKFISTGNILLVNNTPYDFLDPHVIGNTINIVKNGYEVNYVLDHEAAYDGLKIAAILHDKESGRTVKVSTTQPNIYITTANNLDVKGKNGILYKPHGACTIDPQGYPDSLHHTNFHTHIVSKGKPYNHCSVYEFSVRV